MIKRPHCKIVPWLNSYSQQKLFSASASQILMLVKFFQVKQQRSMQQQKDQSQNYQKQLFYGDFLINQVKIFIMQKSNSMKELHSNALKGRQSLPSALSYHSRLDFPQIGDSGFYQESGRKHYQNHSDRLLTIVLPQKYAINNPMIHRQNSLPPPHLQRSQSQSLNKPSQPQQKKNKHLQKASIQSKMFDELDKMRIQLDKKRIIGFQSKKIQFNDLQKKSQKKLSMYRMQEYLLAPSSPNKGSLIKTENSQRQSQYLYNPQNKARYDIIDQYRSRNPTHLSTGLSII